MVAGILIKLGAQLIMLNMKKSIDHFNNFITILIKFNYAFYDLYAEVYTVYARWT